MDVSQALFEGRKRLKAAGIERPALDASLLLAHAIGVSREQILLEGESRRLQSILIEGVSRRLQSILPPRSDRRCPQAGGRSPLPPPALARFADFVTRRAAGECTAYITGIKEFWGMDFTVSPAALVPRPDTETLVEAALGICGEQAREGRGIRALDLCTGCGAVAIALKREKPECEVWAADISGEALNIAALNAEKLLGKPDAIRFLQGDLFDAVDALAGSGPPRFSLITANAPYIPSAAIAGLAPEVRNEPRLALDGGEDGLEIIRRIIAGAPEYLSGGGVLLLEADPSQMDALACLLKGRGFGLIRRYNDLSGGGRVIGGARGIPGGSRG